jgi:hypothetical protein
MIEPRASAPFTGDVRLPLQAPEFDVELRISGAAEGADLEDTEEILSYYFGAVGGGAFCRAGASPQESSFEATERRTDAAELHVSGRARNIDPGAWRILLKMLAQTHYKLDPLGEVRLHGRSETDPESAGMIEVLDCGYPRAAKDIPFPLQIDERLVEQSQFVVRLDFVAEVEDDWIEAIEERLLDWDSVVYLGGYYDDFTEMEEPQLDATETYRASTTSIEHRIRAWNAPFIALESLVNIAIKLHSSYPIVLLAIE